MMGLDEIKSANAEATRNAVLRSALEHVYARATYAKPGLANGLVRKVLDEICDTCYRTLEDLDNE